MVDMRRILSRNLEILDKVGELDAHSTYIVYYLIFSSCNVRKTGSVQLKLCICCWECGVSLQCLVFGLKM